MKTINILLADDHEVVRNGIKLMLAQQKAFTTNIIEAENGEEVINKVNVQSFDIILLDINLPVLDGIKVTKALISKNKKTRILALTMHNEDYVINEMITAGAMGYLLKNTSLDELTKAILTVVNGKSYYCYDAIQALVNISKNNTDKNKENSSTNESKLDEAVLSPREIEVLIYIAKEFSSIEIAEKLCLSRRTVDGHRTNIMNKLNVKNTIGLVKYALQNGLI